MKYSKKICLFTGAVLVSCALICGCGARGEQNPTASATAPTVSNTKQPSQQESEEQKHTIAPWENGGKQPADYTWEEFEALSAEHQIMFQNALGGEAFEAWLNQMQNQPEESPWDEPGAKQPADYTWEEFEALSPEHQMIFQNVLGQEAFEAWMDRAQKQDLSWEEAGAKQPADYTWEEFEALAAQQQMAFQNALGAEDFEAWLNQAQNRSEECPWDEPGAKQPADYTWEEFEALTADQQMAFQNALGAEDFEAWLNQAQNQPEEYPWDEPGAKQPEDYTWEEFEALSAEHQIVFQNVLGGEAFEAWLNRVSP